MIVLPIRNVNQAMFALKILASPTFKLSKCEHAYNSKIHNCTGISATYIVCKLFRSRSIIWLMELQEDEIFIYFSKIKNYMNKNGTSIKNFGSKSNQEKYIYHKIKFGYLLQIVPKTKLTCCEFSGNFIVVGSFKFPGLDPM